MKGRTAIYLGLAFAFGVAASPAAAQSVEGRWLLDVDLDAGSGQATFVLQVEGSNITGTYAGVLGDQNVTGTINGNMVSFGFESPDAGQVTFEGTIEGNTMQGTCEYGMLGAGTFRGSKAS